MGNLAFGLVLTETLAYFRRIESVFLLPFGARYGILERQDDLSFIFDMPYKSCVVFILSCLIGHVNDYFEFLERARPHARLF